MSHNGRIAWIDRSGGVAKSRLPAAGCVTVMQEFEDQEGRPPGIADKELMGLVVGSVVGNESRPCMVLFLGVDNANVAFWVVEGNARSCFA